MKIDLYQVDAFASKPFEGNPAAVCPLEAWLDDALLQAIAAENNLSETAFFVPTEAGYHLRWFTPSVEVDLCGHATLAAAWVVFHALGVVAEAVAFETRSGVLTVRREGDVLTMDFRKNAAPLNMHAEVAAALGGIEIEGLLISDDIVAVVEEASVIERLVPDMQRLKQLPGRGGLLLREAMMMLSLAGLAPVGVEEDPVTGWRIRRSHLLGSAFEYGADCPPGWRTSGAERVVEGERVISGRVAPYLTGQITLPENASSR